MHVGDRDHQSGGRAAAALLIVALLLRPIAAAAEPADPKRESDALFYEGNTLMAEGKVGEACKKFEQSLALVRRGGSLLNLALCREAAGELASALPLFQEALEIAAQDGRVDRQEIARQHLDELRSKLAWITVTPSSASETPGLEITYDGAALPPEKWGTPVPASPGAHVVAASAPGRERFEARVSLDKAGETRSVPIPVLQAIRAAAPLEIKAPAPRDAAPTPPRDVTPAPPRDVALGHASQLGAVVRVDVDPIHPGARVVAGLTFGIVDHLEGGVSALLGRDLGVEPQLTVFFLERSAWKPLLNVGVPIFFTNGTDAGVRGAAGVQWDVSRHIGIFGQVGGAFFPGAGPGYARGVFLPSLGVQGRI